MGQASKFRVNQLAQKLAAGEVEWEWNLIFKTTKSVILNLILRTKRALGFQQT
jgi:hypothetical protein